MLRSTAWSSPAARSKMRRMPDASMWCIRSAIQPPGPGWSDWVMASNRVSVVTGDQLRQRAVLPIQYPQQVGHDQ